MEYEVCNITHKRCYSKVDAQYEVNLARKKHWKRSSRKCVPRRVYKCEFCGAYHLTKETKYDYGKTLHRVSTRNTNERRRVKRMEESIFRYRREYQ